VLTVAICPDGRHVVSADGAGTLRLWDVKTGTARVLEGHSEVFTVAISPDGCHVVSGSGDRTLRLWEVASGREIARLDCDF
jgi:WD40 repeat protein